LATQLPSGWKRDEQGNIYRVLTDRERASLESSEAPSSSKEHGVEPGRASVPSRLAGVAMHWLIWLAAALIAVASTLAVLH
jgi:hypothetical protein